MFADLFLFSCICLAVVVVQQLLALTTSTVGGELLPETTMPTLLLLPPGGMYIQPGVVYTPLLGPFKFQTLLTLPWIFTDTEQTALAPLFFSVKLYWAPPFQLETVVSEALTPPAEDPPPPLLPPPQLGAVVVVGGAMITVVVVGAAPPPPPPLLPPLELPPGNR